MDNKITRKRLVQFLKYEWLKLTAIILTVVFLLCLLFMNIGSKGARLTTGQRYYFYYMPDISPACVNNMSDFLDGDNIFSYDIQSKSVTQFDVQYGVEQLTGWLSLGNGDAIICSNTEENSVLEGLVDTYQMYDMDGFLSDAIEYANQFRIDGTTGWSISNVSKSKVADKFNERLGKDARFKKKAQKEQGINLEYERIQKLYKDIASFEKLLTKDIFVEYQSEANGDTAPKKYAIDLGKLVSIAGKRNITSFAVIGDTTTAVGTALAVFDFKEKQPDLQYETLSVINAIIKATTNILD